MDKINQMREKIGRISDYAFLGVILIVCLVYRIYYFGHLNPGVVLYNSDSVSYFFPVDILRGIIDLYRTPLYAYVIRFFEYVSKDHLVSNIILFQQAVSFVSLIPFYFVSKSIIKNKGLAVIATIFYGCWHPILIQNVHLNPESLCFAGSTLLLLILVKYLEKPEKVTALSLGVFPLFLIMLKPTYFITMGVIFLLFVLRYFMKREERKALCWGLMGALLCAAGVLGYCAMNYKHNGQFVLSNIALNNSIAHISMSWAYEYGKDQEFISLIDRTKHINYYAAPFTINNHFIDNYAICYERFPKYLPQTEDMVFCSNFPDTMNYPPERIKRFIKNSRSTSVYLRYMIKRGFDITVAAYGNLFLLLLLQSAIIIAIYFKYKEVAWAQGFCILFVLGQFFSIWIAGLDDMDRHLIPAYPFIIQIAGSFLAVFISFLKKRKIIKAVS